MQADQAANRDQRGAPVPGGYHRVMMGFHFCHMFHWHAVSEAELKLLPAAPNARFGFG
jgi:hypothetical protein